MKVPEKKRRGRPPKIDRQRIVERFEFYAAPREQAARLVGDTVSEGNGVRKLSHDEVKALRAGSFGDDNDLMRLAAVNAYNARKRDGLSHREALEAIAGVEEGLQLGVKALEKLILEERAEARSTVAAHFRHLISNPESKPAKERALGRPLTTDEALLFLAWNYGYGDGKVDGQGRSRGIDALKRALIEEGCPEPAHTTLRSRRQDRGVL